MTQAPYYISEEGLAKIKEELEELTKVKRREIAERIERAKELGDLSENAEYAEAKEEQGLVEVRIAELKDNIRRAKIIEKGGTDCVNIGSTVKVRVGDKEKTYTVVGAAEADPLEGRISNESPLGRALIGRCLGETCQVEAPSGEATYEIVEIS